MTNNGAASLNSVSHDRVDPTHERGESMKPDIDVKVSSFTHEQALDELDKSK